MVSNRVAINQVCRAAANTEFIDGIDGCLFYLWMIGKAQVVVAAETDDVFFINGDFGLLRAFYYAT